MKNILILILTSANMFIGVGLINDYKEPETIQLESQVVQAIEIEPTEVVEPTVEVVEPAIEVEDPVTWQDNPNSCTADQWIAADTFNCIDKPKVAEKPAVTAQRSTPTGDKYTWMTQAGIPENQWTYVDYIVSKESSWNPNAVNPNGGACGLGQQLPCGKWAGAWNDPVAALKAQYKYVTSRYGGYAQAHGFWLKNQWY